MKIGGEWGRRGDRKRQWNTIRESKKRCKWTSWRFQTRWQNLVDLCSDCIGKQMNGEVGEGTWYFMRVKDISNIGLEHFG